MKYTSAEAAKLLRTLNEEQQVLKQKELKSAVFVASVEEDPETVRPDYDYADMQNKLRLIEEKVRRVKHAVNVFNTTTEVPGFSMTIDQMLVYIPQLSEKKAKLSRMAARLPKEREAAGNFGGRNLVEYSYANYEIAEAEAELAAVTEELAKAQTALDVVNNSLTMEIE